MPDPTFAEQMVAKYQEILLKCAGMTSANIDGRQVALSDLEQKLAYWEAKVAREQGGRPQITSIRLDQC